MFVHDHINEIANGSRVDEVVSRFLNETEPGDSSRPDLHKNIADRLLAVGERLKKAQAMQAQLRAKYSVALPSVKSKK